MGATVCVVHLCGQESGMAFCPYLRRRGARHFLRIRIPYRLREALPMTEFSRSLGTSDPAVARRRAALTVAAIQAAFGIMQDVHGDTGLKLDARQDLFRRLLARAVDDPLFVIEQQKALAQVQDAGQLRGYVHALSVKLREEIAAGRAEQDRLRQEAESAQQARDAAERKAARAARQAEAFNAALGQLTAVGAVQPVELSPGHDQPVARLKEAFMDAKGLKGKTRASYRKAFERLEAVVGDKPVCEIDKTDIVRLVEDMEATRSDKRDRAPLKPATTKKYLSHAREFFRALQEKNRVRRDPTEGVGVTSRIRPQADHEERSPFTPAQLRALLAAPIFRGCRSPHRITEPGACRVRDGRFWYGLVKMFAGLRNAEVEALMTADIVLHHGIWHIDVHKANKTKAGTRLVPIHSALLKMGFLDWVAGRRAAVGEGRLFEKRKYGRIWNEKILPAAGVKTEKTSVYSFRHNFDDGLKELVQDETKKRLMGHATGAMGGRYGNGRVTRAQAEAIERLDLGDIDVGFLFVYATVEEAVKRATS